MSIADPMIALLQLQETISIGPPVDPRELDNQYAKMFDQRTSCKRFSYAKIIGHEVLAVSIFGEENSIDGVVCYNVAYAVNKDHRGRGLAIEAVNKGIEDLQKRSRDSIDCFYIEAVAGVTNMYSVEVAKKLFSQSGLLVQEQESGKPALYFKKLLVID